VCKDAFVVLKGVTRIEYADGDFWALDEGQVEHPLVPKLRAASMVSLLNDPPAPSADDDGNPLIDQLREERRANALLREFARAIEDLCVRAGLPRDEVSGPQVITWLKTRLSVTE
jgi:hypothetical protein